MSEYRTRVIDPESGLTEEIFGTTVMINFDPINNTGIIRHNTQKLVLLNGQQIGNNGSSFPIQNKIEDHLQEAVGNPGEVDPVFGTDLSQISGAGLVMLHRAFFGNRYDEKAAALQPQE